MLIGKSFHTLDDKDRLVIPAKFRRDFETGGEPRCIISRGNGMFLVIHTMESWEETQRRLASLPTNDEGALYYREKILGEAEYCKLDKQGRVTLGHDHKGYAKIDKECVLMGQVNRLNCYGKGIWEDKEKKHEPNFAAYAKRWGV